MKQEIHQQTIYCSYVEQLVYAIQEKIDPQKKKKCRNLSQ